MEFKDESLFFFTNNLNYIWLEFLIHLLLNILMRLIQFFYPLIFLFVLISSSAISQYSSARITGSNINVRSEHSTTSVRKGSLQLNEIVQVLDVYYPSENNNEAIIRSKTNFYSEYNNTFMFSLDAGKAVIVIRNISEDTYRISFKNINGGIGYASISSSLLEFINGEKWYLIKSSKSLVGWVFGKYVDEIY